MIRIRNQIAPGFRPATQIQKCCPVPGTGGKNLDTGSGVKIFHKFQSLRQRSGFFEYFGMGDHPQAPAQREFRDGDAGRLL